MLQRLIYRVPSPVPAIPNDKQIFNKEGKIRDQVLTACQTLKIDPNDLYPKPFEDFQDDKAPENVQILRYNHYESKRQSKINQLKSRMLRKIQGRDHVMSLPTSPAKKRPSLPSSPLGLPSLGGDTNRNHTLTAIDKPGSFFFTEQAGYKSNNVMSSIVEESLSNGERKWTKKLSSDTIKKVNKRVNMPRSASVENFEERNVKAEMVKDFEISLQRRIKEDERMVNASRLIAQREDEYREKLKEIRDRREEKCQNVREKMEKKRLVKIQQLDRTQEVIERRSDLQKADEEGRQERYAQIVNKIEDSERKRNQISTERTKRIISLNETYHQRQNSCVEYKLKMENVGIPDLSMIEERLYTSALRRKYKNFSQNHRVKEYISVGNTERLQKIKEDEEAIRQKVLQKVVEKMARERSFESARRHKRELRELSPSEERHLEHTKRLDEIRISEEMRDLKFKEDVKEKDLRSFERITRKKSDLDAYITERKEVWSLKAENVKTSRMWAEEESEKRLGSLMSSYKERIGQILKEKQDIKTKLGSAREKSKNLNGVI